MGESYETSRKQTVDMIMGLAKGNPEVWALAADVFFENQDFVGADRLAKRFKAMLPPVAQQADAASNGTGGQPEVPPAVKAQLSQAEAQIQMLGQQNQQLIRMLGTKVIEAESKERIADQGNRTKIQVAETMSKSAQMNQQAKFDHDAIEAELDRRGELLHKAISLQAEVTGQQQDQQHEQQQQGAEQAHDVGMTAMAQAHERGMQGAQQDHAAQLQTQAQEAAAQQAKAALMAAPKATK